MGVFVCDLCACVENTALGFFWAAKSGRQFWKDPALHEKHLCSACAPTEYRGGEPSELGAWHGKFPRKLWDGKRAVLNRQPFPSAEAIFAWLRTSFPDDLYPLARKVAKNDGKLDQQIIERLQRDHKIKLSKAKQTRLILRLCQEDPVLF